MRRPVFSRVYAWLSERMEAEGMAALRTQLLSGLTGEVVEIGAGNGMNFRHYPASVSAVSAVEPEPHLRALAERAAGSAPVPVRVLAGVAQRLPLPDAGVDAAVVCLVLCSVVDRPAALAEIARVLRPGGELRFLEHCVAGAAGLRRVQRVVDATVWPRLAGGCRTSTDPLTLIAEAGFTITACRHLRFPDLRVSLPTTPHVLGAAQWCPAARTGEPAS